MTMMITIVAMLSQVTLQTSLIGSLLLAAVGMISLDVGALLPEIGVVVLFSIDLTWSLEILQTHAAVSVP